MHEDSIMASSHDILEIPLDMDHLDNKLPLEPPLEPFERMEFASIEEAMNHYARYVKKKGFSFHTCCVTKSRTNEVINGQECSISLSRHEIIDSSTPKVQIQGRKM